GASRFKLCWAMGSNTVDLRTQVRNPAGVLSPWVSFRHSGNTTVDSNGFIKAASPIVKLFGDGESELNDESQGVTTERVSEGVYRVSGTLGFNSDGAWGGSSGGIGLPKDVNDLPLIWVDYEVDETGDLLIKTFHRVNSTAPKFAQNVKTGYKEGQPIDIPAGRWIDLRVEMPGGDEPEYEPVPEVEEAPEVTPEVTELEGGEEQTPGESGQGEEPKE
ncbi:phage tail fiber protein, partial [Serratia fonticola]